VREITSVNMKPYFDPNHDSGISAYENGRDYIKIQFKDGAMYLYTYASAGSHCIEKMKSLAENGDGLNAYINEEKPDYASKQS